MKRIIFYGDSITDCNRNYSAPHGTEEQWGQGYVRHIVGQLFMNSLDYYQVINKGINGNTVIDLVNRFDKDIAVHQPDYVAIMIGINDVWRHFDTLLQDCELVNLDTFSKTYEFLIQKVEELGSKCILIDPFYLENNREEPLRKMLDIYREKISQLSINYDVLYINTQSYFDSFLESNSAYTFSIDRVHMNYLGNTYLGSIICNQLLPYLEDNKT